MEQHQTASEQDVSKLDTIPGNFAVEALEQTAAAAAEQKSAALAETDAGVYVHRLSSPLHWEGRTYETLTFRWDALTGGDHLDIESELLARGKTLVVPEYTGGYLCGMAVRACTERDEKGRRVLPSAAFRTLPLGDFMDICGKARNFLFHVRQRGGLSGSGSGSNA